MTLRLTQESKSDFLIAIGHLPPKSLTVILSVLFFFLLTYNEAGTAVLSKIKPLNVTYVLPGHPDPASVKGRLITLEFPNTYLVSTYVVNAGTDLKVAFESRALRALLHLHSSDAGC